MKQGLFCQDAKGCSGSIERYCCRAAYNIQTLERRKIAVKNNIRLAQLLILIMISFCGHAMAQSTLFNIPTTDTVAKGKAYAEFDFVPQIPAFNDSRIYFFNPRLVVGAPRNFELGVNFPIYNTQSSGDSATSGYIQPNAKWKFYDNEKAGVALAVGGVLNTPLNHRDGQDSWGYIYGLVSKKVKTGDYGPRFHGGAYGVISNDHCTGFCGTRAGAILGYEQPLSKKISFVADWFSQKNYLGYFTPGVSIALPKNGLLNVGYMIGNDSWENSNAIRNRYLMVYYGVTF
jgi:hypothetical protein